MFTVHRETAKRADVGHVYGTAAPLAVRVDACEAYRQIERAGTPGRYPVTDCNHVVVWIVEVK